MSAAVAPHIELAGIGKRYGGIQALGGIDLAIAPGTVHALVGENGAGKSTLGKIVGGVIRPDDGEMRVLGEPVRHHAPRDALRHGITVIAQEIALVPDRSIIENVFLGLEPRRAGFVSSRALRRRFAELAERASFELPPDAVVGTLPLAEQQRVEILRGLARDAKLIVFDEPTAALSPPEARALFASIGRLREAGTTIVYVSHFLEEVLALADAVTILKDGRLVRTADAAAETVETLITSMLGRALKTTFPAKVRSAPDAPVVLEIEGLGRGTVVQDASLHVRAGEIVALAGLVGAGRSELARLIFGADRADRGVVRIDGDAFRARRPGDALRRGIAMLPESRKEQALVMDRSVLENVTLAHLGGMCVAGGFVASSREWSRGTAMLERVGVRPQLPKAPVSALSGGNQQKVALGKWLIETPRLLIVDEPTRGVDVGAKRAIYDLIVALAQQGMAVLLISSEVEEALGLAHRVLVMRGGRIVAELDGETTPEAVMSHAFGAVGTEPHTTTTLRMTTGEQPSHAAEETT
ncbi:MAG: transporter related protein [Conexibacter sp.]|nr:transporter related protein [Conexibacter sp.]